MTIDFECPECGHEGRISMPMGINFLPDADL